MFPANTSVTCIAKVETGGDMSDVCTEAVATVAALRFYEVMSSR